MKLIRPWIGIGMVALLLPLAAVDAAEPIEVRKIWDAAPHNAFTDLVRWKDRWWCTFREGTGHVNYPGKLRLITSADGEKWESAFLMRDNFSDLRDPKLCVTPKNELMWTGAAAMHPPISFRHQTLAWFSHDGRQWSDASKIGGTNEWLWRVTWHKGIAYSVAYKTGGARGTRLYTSRNGRTFEVLVDNLFDQGYPNEHGLAFLPDDTAVCLLRRDGDPKTGANTAQLGTAKPPYKEWSWRDLDLYVGGPCLIRVPDGRLIAGGRRLIDPATDPSVPTHSDGKFKGQKMIPGRRCSLWELDLAQAKLHELVTLPSGGDTSYPGLVWHNGLLWVSYYSSHEGKTCIHLAKVKL